MVIVFEASRTTNDRSTMMPCIAQMMNVRNRPHAKCHAGRYDTCRPMFLHSTCLLNVVRPSFRAGPPRSWRHFCSPHVAIAHHSITHPLHFSLIYPPHLHYTYKMFAARQVSQSVFGAAQRRAFSASASNVSELNSQQTIRSIDRDGIQLPMPARPIH